MQVRRVEPRDLERVRGLAREQLRENYSEDLFRYFFENYNGCFLVADDVGTVEGFILAVPLDVSTLRIMMLVVGGERKRRGTGSLLLAQAEGYASLRKMGSIVLEVGTTNPEAIGFYTSKGFEITSVLHRYYNDGGDAYIMRRYLPI